jgi:hypothetical protein
VRPPRAGTALKLFPGVPFEEQIKGMKGYERWKALEAKLLKRLALRRRRGKRKRGMRRRTR